MTYKGLHNSGSNFHFRVYYLIPHSAGYSPDYLVADN